MTTVPLSEAKANLSALVEAAENTHDIVTITRHGRPAAVLMSADDLESLHETVFWAGEVSRTEIDADLAATNQYVSGSSLRASYGLDE